MRTVVRGRRNPAHFTLPTRLKEARKAADYPSTYLSADAGWGRSMVFSIEEEGRVPGVDVVETLALCLGCSPCWLAYAVEREFTAECLQAPGIGARLRQAREMRSMDKNALGRAAGTTGQTIANIETGRNIPSVATAEALAKALDISPCWLAFGEGPQTSPRLPRRGRAPSASGPSEGQHD